MTQFCWTLTPEERAELKELLGREPICVDEITDPADVVDVYEAVDDLLSTARFSMQRRVCGSCTAQYPKKVSLETLLPGWSLHEMFERSGRRSTILCCPACNTHVGAIAHASIPNLLLAS